jgi:hypothetical protein
MGAFVVSTLRFFDDPVEIVERKGLGHPQTPFAMRSPSHCQGRGAANIARALAPFSTTVLIRRCCAAVARRRPSVAARSWQPPKCACTFRISFPVKQRILNQKYPSEA